MSSDFIAPPYIVIEWESAFGPEKVAVVDVDFPRRQFITEHDHSGRVPFDRVREWEFIKAWDFLERHDLLPIDPTDG